MAPPRLIEPCPPYTKVVSGFNDWRVINGIPAQHAGVDKSQTENGNPMPTGTPFIASFVGGSRVHFAGWGDKNTGNMVILRQGLWEARGMHLRDVVVSVGQDAPERMLLGHCDNTGLSTGTHLHFDVSAATKEEALLVQPDPVLAYGRWRVNPQLLLVSEEEEEMKIFIARPSGRCFLVGGIRKAYIAALPDLGALQAAYDTVDGLSDAFVDSLP